MEENTEKKKITTGKFRVSFPHVFKPQTTPSGSQRYSLVMLVSKADKATVSALQKLMKQAAYDKWGQDAVESKKLKINWPLHDGEEKSDKYAGYEDCVYATAGSEQKPNVVGKNLEILTNDSELYPGCYARASVNAYAWEWKGKKGVSFGLFNVQKLADGDRFGFSSKPEDDFDVVEDSDENYAETEEGMFG